MFKVLVAFGECNAMTDAHWFRRRTGGSCTVVAARWLVIAVIAVAVSTWESQAWAADSAAPASVEPVVTAAAPASPALPAEVVQVPAKKLFAAAKTAAPLEARAIGFYSRGCLAGGVALSGDGPEWQAMRLSRNRYWGHPTLITFLQRFASDAKRLDGWPGLLVGDLSQPRGGPMESSHASHQVGLDVDIWFDPMPQRKLTAKEREEQSASTMLLADGLTIDPAKWTGQHLRLMRRAASFGEVERVFVHPAIKKSLCETSVNDPDRTWLGKMRPFWGHNDHFHVRIRCPEGTPGCEPQPLPSGDDGCGKELTDWFALLTAPPKPAAKSDVPPKPLTLDKLPADCRTVLDASPTVQNTTAPNAGKSSAPK